MKENIEFQISKALYVQFKAALVLCEDDPNALLEEWIQKYTHSAFSKAAGIETKEEVSDNNTINKIRKWATKNNIPHKLIKSFLKSRHPETGACNKRAMLNNFLELEEIQDENTYLKLRKQFNDNYSQMKSNGAHAHGNIFYDDGENVYLVSDVKNEILKLKDKFTD